MKNTTKSPSRRRFMELLGQWATAGAALVILPNCGSAEDVLLSKEDDLGMHGPIQQAAHWLEKPVEKGAIPLLRPYHQGQLFQDRWSFVHATRGSQDQLVLIIVDVQTNGHLELHLFDSDIQIRPIATSKKFAIILNDGGRGDRFTPPHLRYLAEDVADLLRANEKTLRRTLEIPQFDPSRPFLEPLGPNLEIERYHELGDITDSPTADSTDEYQ